MRQLMVLVAGLLLIAGCGATPATETHTVSFTLTTLNPTAYTDIKAEFEMEPLGGDKEEKYDTTWSKDVVVHYPDVKRVAVSGETEIKDDARVPDPGAGATHLRCEIWIDDVLVAENEGFAVTCVHTMTAGKQVEYKTP
jgi:hypothetical protein